jgi:hypothetical protein
MRAVGAPLCEAIAAYAGERYAQAFDTLFPLRSQLGRVGGSRAQVSFSQKNIFN